MKHTNIKKPHIKTETMIELYNQGLSTSQIGKRLDLFKSSVSKRLKKSGIILRRSSDYSKEKRYWLWKGDNYIDPITRKRNQRLHRKWSKLVQGRDNHTCQDCGIKNVTMHSHHLISLKKCINSELEFDINNGITLCVKCHKYRHKEQEI